MLTTSYPKSKNDFKGIFVYRLEKALTSLGVEVQIIVPRGYKISEKNSLLSNVRASFSGKIELIFYLLHFIRLVGKKAKKSDIIHANWTISGFAAIMSKRKHRKKIIMTVRSPFLVDSKNFLIKNAMKFVLDRVDKIITISEESKRKLLRKYPSLRRKISVINNGIDTNAFCPRQKQKVRHQLGLPKDKRIFIFFGRISKIKGLDFLIDAFRDLSINYKNLLLIFVGEGEYKRELELQTKADKNIIFAGPKRHAEVPFWVSAADIFVSPSLSETGGNIILEALSSGLPVISTRVGWAEEVIRDGFNGILIRKRSKDDIKMAALKILNSKSFESSLAKNARNSTKSLSWESCAKKYMQEYNKLLKNKTLLS